MVKRLAFTGLLAVILAVFMISVTDVAQAQIFKGSNWTGSYYNNPTFTGTPVFTRIDPAVEFFFGSGAVTDAGTGLSVGPDNYSVRWTTQFNFAPGTYNFGLTREDDARVVLNGVPIFEFSNVDRTGAEFVQASVTVPGGLSTITVEYVKRTGSGIIQLQWQTVGGSGFVTPGTPTVAPTVTRTPLPPIPPGAITATVIRASVLNTRDAPSLGGNVIGRILRGETYAIVGRDVNARWFLLQLAGKQGWAWGYYLFINGNEYTPPVVSAVGTIGVPPGVPDTGVIVQSQATLRLREAPNVASTQIGRVTWGAFLPVVGRTGDGFWYQVVWKGTVGWIYSPFVKNFQGDPLSVPIR